MRLDPNRPPALSSLARTQGGQAAATKPRSNSITWRQKLRYETNANCCPVPLRGTGRYRAKSKVNGAQLKLAATKSRATATTPAMATEPAGRRRYERQRNRN